MSVVNIGTVLVLKIPYINPRISVGKPEHHTVLDGAFCVQSLTN